MSPALAGFVQKEPVEGAEPTDRMEVRFAYDDTALYVGARMYSDAPIQAPMGRRDERRTGGASASCRSIRISIAGRRPRSA